MAKRALWMGGIGIYGVVTYSSFLLYKVYMKKEIFPMDPELQANYEFVWDKMIDYDDKIEWDEYWLGFNGIRRELLSNAQGKVLETSAGTCRNLDFYIPEKVASIDLIDSSTEMLRNGLKKQNKLKAKFTKMHADKLLFPSQEFDTVVDTFGLCSHADPKAALREMYRVCKPHGQLLLLEHGRTNKEWINTALDKTALDHAMKWGCWWNRDIVGLVTQSGWKIHDIKYNHFGTTTSIICKK